MNWRPLRSENGFTLLEVMIALAIVLICFTAILGIQGNSINSSIRTRQNHTVAMLLKQIVTKTEFELEGKTFQEIGTEKSGAFDEPFQDYSWKREIKKVAFPNLTSLSSSATGADGSGGGSGGGSSAGGNNIAEMLGQIITKFLKTALRQVEITVSWKRGSGTLSESVTIYWVDYNAQFNLSPGGSADD
ncbi:MAG: type II secretion system protein [Bdellovibrionales bacterium]|nr:type II secretion system protein [Bdellovibrionales bacterium]